MSDERRTSARILTEFPLTLSDDKGDVLDPHAIAHDVSDKGFKIETHAELSKGQTLRFALALDAEGDIKGRARVVWCERADVSYWAGAQFLKLSWADRRRMGRITSPSRFNWDALADRTILSLGLLLAAIVGYRALTSTLWRGILGDLVPAAVAAFAMGWALKELLRRR
ncbi:MAG TPA: PilZ domain-containing protein [Elusimicrobiota bacterium]|nr:PilZ domain-containing protein [Elusimicrobiota bacterium]